MARKNKKSLSSSLLVWLLLTVVSGGGAAYVKPDLPIIGPIVADLVAQAGIKPKSASEQFAGPSLDGHPHAGPAINGPTGDFANTSNSNQPVDRPQVQLASARRPPESILIASFNIQVLGVSKMSKPGIVELLAHALRQFDIVAIQEIRAKDDNILPRLVAAINADGSRYDFLIGPRLGRTVSTEQYAFVYDTTRIEHDPATVGTIQDSMDLLHREPFLARFRARTDQPDQAFTFWLINAHTDPDEVPDEVAALANVFRVMQRARPDEDDVILLGDLNANESQLGPLAQIPGVTWAVQGTTTNTRRTKLYDNLIFQSQATSEYTGRWGVYDLERVYGLSREDALKVSDHLPVWAEFGIWEGASQGRFANRPKDLLR